jgi:hypothetical protein
MASTFFTISLQSSKRGSATRPVKPTPKPPRLASGIEKESGVRGLQSLFAGVGAMKRQHFVLKLKKFA